MPKLTKIIILVSFFVAMMLLIVVVFQTQLMYPLSPSGFRKPAPLPWVLAHIG